MNAVNNIQIIPLQSPSIELSVLEVSKILLREIKRIFIVNPEIHANRGKHAHKTLTQLLICVNGVCEVICDDGKEKKIFRLSQINQALLIPPGIWAEQIYHKKDTTLLVACDAEYDEADYIRDYDEFLKFRSMIQEEEAG
ncbi:MAG: FdtA/QdtA family cupin domain-containing protein [Gammaproteobacteria bacterium]|nr:FdtA/QdtA family cupin domain-containing protein [Gammaproteobacteria bacterium]